MDSFRNTYDLNRDVNNGYGFISIHKTIIGQKCNEPIFFAFPD